ncbi:MAG: NAD(+) synthase, partial [Clostridiales bacterium]|nr:NAD(+) synthase [Clostridiales bacterium]
MKDGFIKVAVATPEVRVADCQYNVEQIVALIKEAEEKKVKILVFPELCITGYTCGDLFLQELLLEQAEEQVEYLLEQTKGMEMVIAVGAPISYKQKLYNCAIWIQNGEILGIVPKKNIPNYNEFYEGRYFV